MDEDLLSTLITAVAAPLLILLVKSVISADHDDSWLGRRRRRVKWLFLLWLLTIGFFALCAAIAPSDLDPLMFSLGVLCLLGGTWQLLALLLGPVFFRRGR